MAFSSCEDFRRMFDNSFSACLLVWAQDSWLKGCEFESWQERWENVRQFVLSCLLVTAPDSWSKGCKFESWQERQENFLLQCQLCVLTLIRCPFHPHVTTVAHKRPRSFCQKCRWRVTPKHTYTLDPSKPEWADYAVVHAECGNLSGNELTRNSSGNTRLQSSQLAKSLWTDPGLKGGISLRELISTLKKKKKNPATPIIKSCYITILTSCYFYHHKILLLQTIGTSC